MKKYKFEIFKKNLWKFRRKCLKKDCGIFWLPKNFFKIDFFQKFNRQFLIPPYVVFGVDFSIPQFWKFQADFVQILHNRNQVFDFGIIAEFYAVTFCNIRNGSIYPGAYSESFLNVCTCLYFWTISADLLHVCRLQNGTHKIIYWSCAWLQNFTIYYSNPERIQHQYIYISLFYLSYIGLIWLFCEKIYKYITMLFYCFI